MEMSFRLVVGALLFSMTSGAAAQPATAKFAAVQKVLPKSEVRKLPLDGRSTEGGELIGYFKNNSPQKIVARYWGESGRSSEEYYFWKGQLFFVLRNDWDYEKPLVGNNSNPGKEFRRQERFYFTNGKLTKWIGEGGKSNVLTTTAALRAQQDFISEARGLLKMLQKKSS